MVWPARRVAALLACGVCALGVATTIAFATPAHPGSRRHSTTRRRTCSARVHGRTRRGRRAASCAQRPSHHRSSHARKPSGSNGSTETTTPTTGSGALPSAPGASGSGTTAESGQAPPPKPPSIPHVQVTAVEYSYTLSRTTVPAGEVIFDFVNHGQDEHNLNVQPAGGEVVDSLPNTQAHVSSEQEVVLRAGTYTLFCSLPEHEKKGMKATLVVE